MFSHKCLSFRSELVDEFHKIVPIAFGPFISHHQGLLACVMLVLPLQLFPDDLKCKVHSIAFHLKNHSIPKSKFRKILVENTPIIAHEIDKLRLQILGAQHIKTKK